MENQTLILVHGRHLQTQDWETLVWGSGNRIGSAPLGLYLAVSMNGQLFFGTGASEKDGVPECVYTHRFLGDNLSRLTQFPEFLGFGVLGPEWLREVLTPRLEEAHLDAESRNTYEEIRNAIGLARTVGADQIVQVTSPGHVARCANTTAMLIENSNLNDIRFMVVSSRSSTEGFCAAHTVVFEHPHRGDDPMISAELMPHQVFPRIFRLSPERRRVLFSNLDTLLMKEGV